MVRICRRVKMKALKSITTVSIVVLFGLFCYIVVDRYPRDALGYRTNSPEYDGYDVILSCIHYSRPNCTLNLQQLRPLLQHLGTTKRAPRDGHVAKNVSKNEAVGDNKWYMNSPEGMVRKLSEAQLNLQMRSDPKSRRSIINTGQDNGLSKACVSRNYGDFRGWPKASVIIPFCDNELLSDVMHTVHSIIQRSPDELLEEVILIDDNTSKDDFKELLDNYCKAVLGAKVRIIRSNVTLGLIKGRLLGTRLSRGDVIVTMDAHMEVQDTWLQALIYEIRRDRKTLATAMLDWMTPLSNGSWKYDCGTNSFMCMFSWDLGFGFAYPRPEIQNKRDKMQMDAFPAPCSVGTIWAMDKDFFREIGELDDGMELWGGENLELPIRTWLFGGRAVQVPCSHAAHLERPRQRDYRVGWAKAVNMNYKRVVEVWFDDYKKHVYRMIPELESMNVTDLSQRFELKKRAVHDFKWFLENVYPELGLYDNGSFGYDWLRNIGLNKCLHRVDGKLILWDCMGQPIKEGAWLTADGHLRTDVQYWQVQGNNQNEYKIGAEGATGYYQADWISKWIHWKGGPMMMYRSDHGVSDNMCMEAYNTPENSLIKLTKCDPESEYQRWEWKAYTDEYWEFMEKRTRSKYKSDYHKAVLDVKALLKWRYVH